MLTPQPQDVCGSGLGNLVKMSPGSCFGVTIFEFMCLPPLHGKMPMGMTVMLVECNGAWKTKADQ
eukprot:6188122-Ditylum_brightwellii.AAC.1